MQPVEKVNKLFIAKLLILGCLLYLGFLMKVPQFVKSTDARDLEQYALPANEHEPKQIKKLYYRLVSHQEPEEISI